MKKVSILLLLSANALFLTGCWNWKKKTANSQEETNPIKINSNNCDVVSPEIAFDENNNPHYILTPGKTIFDDKEELSIESTTLDENQQAISQNENCLNDFIIQEEQNNSNQNAATIIENSKKHIDTVLFGFDQYEHISSQYENSLKGAIAQISLELQKNPNTCVIIEGHACNSCGSERYNLELSNKRALNIKNTIVNETGIHPDKLSVFGCGTSHLIVHGNRHEQAPNRRVEIFILN